MLSKREISLIIIIFIGLQIYAGIKGHGRSWPFIEYRMYGVAHNPGDRVERLHLYGATASREVREIFPEDFGLWYFPFNNQVTPKLLKPETRLACTAELLSLYNSRVNTPEEKLTHLTIVMDYDELTPKGRPERQSETLLVYRREEP